jgi:hypothetical protein
MGHNRYAFFNSLNNGVIQVPNASTNEGQKLQAGKPCKALNEQWELIPADNGQYGGRDAFYFKNWCGQCMDVYECKAKNEQPVIQWGSNGDKNQVWIIEKVE